MRKSDRKMIANMFGMLAGMITILFYEDDEDKEKEMQTIVDRMNILDEEIDAWVEEE